MIAYAALASPIDSLYGNSLDGGRRGHCESLIIGDSSWQGTFGA
jgi:hypothetical protein